MSDYYNNQLALIFFDNVNLILEIDFSYSIEG